jgi:excisionase family DNA binding protein
VVQPAQGSARLLTVAEVARTLRVSNMTVYRLVNAGELPALRIGKSYRLRADDIDQYLADRFTQAG